MCTYNYSVRNVIIKIYIYILHVQICNMPITQSEINIQWQHHLIIQMLVYSNTIKSDSGPYMDIGFKEKNISQEFQNWHSRPKKQKTSFQSKSHLVQIHFILLYLLTPPEIYYCLKDARYITADKFLKFSKIVKRFRALLYFITFYMYINTEINVLNFSPASLISNVRLYISACIKKRKCYLQLKYSLSQVISLKNITK